MVLVLVKKRVMTVRSVKKLVLVVRTMMVSVSVRKREDVEVAMVLVVSVRRMVVRSVREDVRVTNIRVVVVKVTNVVTVVCGSGKQFGGWHSSCAASLPRTNTEESSEISNGK